jgi:hypothetical protein
MITAVANRTRVLGRERTSPVGPVVSWVLGDFITGGNSLQRRFTLAFLDSLSEFEAAYTI